MDADAQHIGMVALGTLLLWGLLSGGFVDRPDLRRRLRALWAQLKALARRP